MNAALLLFSLAARILAVGWVLVLLHRRRDWRIAALTLLLLLLAAGQGVALYAPRGGGPLAAGLDLAISIVALATLFQVGRRPSRGQQPGSKGALHESEARFRAIFKVAEDAIFIKNTPGRYFQVNPAMERLFGQAGSELIGKTDEELFDPATAARIRAGDARVLAGETVVEESAKPVNGQQQRTFHVAKVPMRDQTGRITGLCGIARDMTERTQAERALREAHEKLEEHVRRRTAELAASEERWRSLARTAPDFILLLDPDGTIKYINRASPGIRVEDLIGTNIREHAFPEYHGRIGACIDEVLRTGEFGSIEVGGGRTDGSPARYAYRFGPFRQDGQGVGLTCIATDISDHRRTEERLKQSERLALVGTLAAGVAHEINNPVGGILMAAEAALDELKEARDRGFLEKCLSEIAEDSRRCGRVVKSILCFARQQPTEKWPSDVNALVKRVLDVTREIIQRHEAAIELELAPDLPEVRLNPTEFQQVLANLIQNAVESGGKGTRVRVGTRRNGALVRITVADDGPGIAAAHQRHIFDPFYTTRLQTGGTGLGLSVVHGIVEAHGGSIEAESTPQRGATFAIDLPVSGEGAGNVQSPGG